MSATPIRRRATNIGRLYETPDGASYPSVTNILSVIAKPALLNWYAKTEREMVIETSATLYEEAPKEKMSRLGWIATLRKRLGKEKAAKKLLDAASDIGSQAHGAIEWTLRDELGQKQAIERPVLQGASLWAYMAWEDWRKKVRMVPRHIEQIVFSRDYGYAGTIDLDAEFNDPGLGGRFMAISDWKTGKNIYLEARLQLAAYRHALVEMGHGGSAPMHGFIVRLPKVETDPDFEVAYLTPAELDTHFQTFLYARDLWVACREYEGKAIQDIRENAS